MGGKEGEERRVKFSLEFLCLLQGIVQLTHSSEGLLLGYRHTLTPQMALSCLVTSPEVEVREV